MLVVTIVALVYLVVLILLTTSKWVALTAKEGTDLAAVIALLFYIIGYGSIGVALVSKLTSLLG